MANSYKWKMLVETFILRQIHKAAPVAVVVATDADNDDDDDDDDVVDDGQYQQVQFLVRFEQHSTGSLARIIRFLGQNVRSFTMNDALMTEMRCKF